MFVKEYTVSRLNIPINKLVKFEGLWIVEKKPQYLCRNLFPHNQQNSYSDKRPFRANRLHHYNMDCLNTHRYLRENISQTLWIYRFWISWMLLLSGFPFFFIPWNSLIFPWLFPDFLTVFPDCFFVFIKTFLNKCGFQLPLGSCLQKHQFIIDTLPLSKTSLHNHTKSYVHTCIYCFWSIYQVLEIFPDLKICSLILVENPLFFPDFPDWKKCSKFSLISLNSLIGGNPVLLLQLQIGHDKGLLPPAYEVWGRQCFYRRLSLNQFILHRDALFTMIVNLSTMRGESVSPRWM